MRLYHELEAPCRSAGAGTDGTRETRGVGASPVPNDLSCDSICSSCLITAQLLYDAGLVAPESLV